MQRKTENLFFTACVPVLHTFFTTRCHSKRRKSSFHGRQTGMSKLLIGVGIGVGLALALVVGVVGFWFSSTAFAQGPTPGTNGFPGYAACHNDTAVLQLLGTSEQDLLAQRQAGKSLLDIAKA